MNVNCFSSKTIFSVSSKKDVLLVKIRWLGNYHWLQFTDIKLSAEEANDALFSSSFFPFFALLPPLSACWCLSLFISNIFSHIWTRHDWHASCQKCRWAVHQTCDEYMKNQPQFWGWGKIDFTTKPIFLLLSSHKYHLKIEKKHIGFVYNKKCLYVN